MDRHARARRALRRAAARGTRSRRWIFRPRPPTPRTHLVRADTPSPARGGGQGGGPIRVLIVDDQALIRAGFRMILEAQPDLEVVGEAGDGSAAIDAVRTLRPDVVLMDIRMPGVDGIEATRRLTEAGVPSKIVILTAHVLDKLEVRDRVQAVILAYEIGLIKPGAA